MRLVEAAKTPDTYNTFKKWMKDDDHLYFLLVNLRAWLQGDQTRNAHLEDIQKLYKELLPTGSLTLYKDVPYDKPEGVSCGDLVGRTIEIDDDHTHGWSEDPKYISGLEGQFHVVVRASFKRDEILANSDIVAQFVSDVRQSIPQLQEDRLLTKNSDISVQMFRTALTSVGKLVKGKYVAVRTTKGKLARVIDVVNCNDYNK